jgi:DNA-directed RNA polymerase sigma subunit (sigma70/sigma32)
VEGGDEQLVIRWQQRRDVSSLNELRRRLRPLTQSQVNKYRANSVSTPLIESEADRILVASADSFKPGAGASFRTHVFNNLRRLNRFSIARSNIATIPEARAQNIGTFQRVYDDLADTRARPPTTSELADALSWSPKSVLTMQRSLRRDVIGSGITVASQMDMTGARMRSVMDDIWYELTPEEQTVYALVTGSHGKRKTEKGQDIAKATGFSQAKVSQLRSAVARKIEAHL